MIDQLMTSPPHDSDNDNNYPPLLDHADDNDRAPLVDNAHDNDDDDATDGGTIHLTLLLRLLSTNPQ